MEEWQKAIFETIESVTDMVDEFFTGVTEIVEVLADEVQSTIGVEIEQYLQDIFDQITEIFDLDEDETLSSEWQANFTYFTSYPMEPNLEEHPACIGCRNFHGQIYNGNLFVCAMHPYGWEAENCPDWESNKI